MKIIFCNGSYLRYYDGRVSGELLPKKIGSWSRENEEIYEKWNFLNMDGMCYGYVQGSSGQMDIEKLDEAYAQQETAEDILVVWCASNHENKTVVVGWYEHAAAYRFLHDMPVTPVSGLERCYWFSTKAEDAYLLPEEDRVFEIGTDIDFDQQNYWYADPKCEETGIFSEMTAFIEKSRDKRINTLNEAFEEPADLKPLSENDLDYVESLSDEEDKEFLPFAYRMFAVEPTADNAYKVAGTLSNLYQYKKSIPWYEKVLELDPADWDTAGVLAYIYTQCGEYEKTIQAAEKLLTFGRGAEPAVRDEVYCMLADAHFFNGDIAGAVSWQDRIIKESKNQNLIDHTIRIQEEWKEYK